jgi:prevent-host-death family protein
MIGDAHRRRKRGRSTTVSATEAAKNFGEIVDRVREAGVPCVVERKGRPIAEISPVSRRRCSLAELARWFEARRPLPDAYTAAVEHFVAKANRPRIPAPRWER